MITGKIRIISKGYVNGCCKKPNIRSLHQKKKRVGQNEITQDEESAFLANLANLTVNIWNF
jgi:hypothetical protein